MNAKTDTRQTGSKADTLKHLIVIAMLVAGSVAFTHYEDKSLLLRVLSMLGVVGVAFAIFATTALGKRSMQFVRDARIEVRKVVWPTRAETVQTTLIVIAMVVIVGLMLWIMDSFLSWAVKAVITPGA